MAYPSVYTAVVGNQYFHVMSFATAGDMVPTHRHTYDHVFQVLEGSFNIFDEREAKPIVARKWDLIPIPKDVAHGMAALEDRSIGQCIHICRWPNGDIVPFSYKLSPLEQLEVTGAM